MVFCSEITWRFSGIESEKIQIFWDKIQIRDLAECCSQAKQRHPSAPFQTRQFISVLAVYKKSMKQFSCCLFSAKKHERKFFLCQNSTLKIEVLLPDFSQSHAFPGIIAWLQFSWKSCAEGCKFWSCFSQSCIHPGRFLQGQIQWRIWDFGQGGPADFWPQRGPEPKICSKLGFSL